MGIISEPLCHSLTRSHAGLRRSNFWLPIPALSELGITLDSKGHHSCGKNFPNTSCGSVVVNGGPNLTLLAINPSDGQDACGACHCPLAFFALERGLALPQGLQPGTKVQMAWSPVAGPPVRRPKTAA
eukprot:COSAG01_NODE_6118_length_3842_cov_3.927064_2_plen_128_part_00